MIFYDSNILIYAIDNIAHHRHIAQTLLSKASKQNATISVQVLSEFINAVRRKKLLSESECAEFCHEFIEIFQVQALQSSTVLLALNIKKRYHFSYWDSLIVAAALQAGCGTLYSEDMQHQQHIAHEPYTPLTIINPFLNTA